MSPLNFKLLLTKTKARNISGFDSFGFSISSLVRVGSKSTPFLLFCKALTIFVNQGSFIKVKIYCFLRLFMLFMLYKSQIQDHQYKLKIIKIGNLNVVECVKFQRKTFLNRNQRLP